MDFDFPTRDLKLEDYSPVQVIALKEYYKNYFESILNKVNYFFLFYIQITDNNEKTYRVYIDKYCYDYLRIIYSKEDLEELKITKDKILTKDIKPLLKIDEDLMIIICQPDEDILGTAITLYMVLKQTFFNFIFIPCETYDLINILMGPGIGNRYSVTSFKIDLIPIDNDLISMERINSFKEIYADKDTTPISDFAESFIKLELFFGKAKHKYIKGEKAKLFNNLLEQKESIVNMKTTDEILGMIILDRSVDFITPFTCNYTYEGLFDEHFGINRGYSIFENKYLTITDNKKKEKNDKETDKDKDKGNQKVLYYLTSDHASQLYNEMKCMNYLDANKYMFQLKAYYKNEAQKKNPNPNDLAFVQKIMETWKEFLTIYKNPLEINEKFMNKFIEENLLPDNVTLRKKEGIFLCATVPSNLKLFYDDYIADKKNLYKLITLLILETLTQGCVKEYNSLKRDILNVYGYQYIFLLRDLETIGLIKERADAIGLIKEKVNIKNMIMELTYPQILNKLGLINPDANNPKNKFKDCSYIFQGYCPIILRLIERAVEGKWGKLKDVITKIPGYTLFPENEQEIEKPPLNEHKVHTIFVVFVGGISYNEIAGIRFINRKLKLAYDRNKERDKNATRVQLIIVTTEILNKKKIFDSLGKEFGQSLSFQKLSKEIENEQKKKK